MSHSSESHPTLASLQKEVRRMRLIFGGALILMALMLMLTLPSIIKNSLFRASAQPETIGALTKIVHFIRGEELPVEPVPSPDTY